MNTSESLPADVGPAAAMPYPSFDCSGDGIFVPADPASSAFLMSGFDGSSCNGNQDEMAPSDPDSAIETLDGPTSSVSSLMQAEL